MALKLDILANTRQFVSESKKAGASLEDISDSLDDLARDAKTDGQKTERAIDDIGEAAEDTGRDIDKAGDKMERTFREMTKDAQKAERAVKDVGDKAKSSTSSGFGDASAASSEFKDEALSNFSEITSSFDGSMESIGELAQGTLGGIAANIPGIGIAAGVAALGIGAITAEIQRTAEKAEETKQSVIDSYLEIGDALDKEAVDARVRDILGVEETRKEAELLAELMDSTVGEAALALAGDFESAGTTAEEAWEAINLAPGDINMTTWENLKTTLRATEDGMRYGKEAADAQADANRRTAESARKAAEANRKQTERLRDFFEEARRPTPPINQKVSLVLDDRAVRNYVPPTKTMRVNVQPTRGRTMSWE